MPPEEADSTEGTAKPRQLAEPEECPGGAKIKPPFEMGVSDFEQKARKVLGMLKRGVKFMPTQPDVLSILEKLKQKE